MTPPTGSLRPENGKSRLDSPIPSRDLESLFPRRRGQTRHCRRYGDNQPRACATCTITSSTTPQLLQALPAAGSLTIYYRCNHRRQHFLGRRKCKHPYFNPRERRFGIAAAIRKSFHAFQEPHHSKVAARLFFSPQAIRDHQARHQAQRCLSAAIHTQAA